MSRTYLTNLEVSEFSFLHISQQKGSPCVDVFGIFITIVVY